MSTTNNPTDNLPPSDPPERTYLQLSGTIALGSYLLLFGFLLIQYLFLIWPQQPQQVVAKTNAEVLSDVAMNVIKKIPKDSTRTVGQAVVMDIIDSLNHTFKRPNPTATTSVDSLQNYFLFIKIGKKRAVPREKILLLLTLLMGALGSWLHATSSFVAFVGNRDFIRSWVPWYVIRPFVGAILALLFYMVIRAGLVTSAGLPAELSYFSVAAFAGLVGLFSERATKKLAEIFEVVFAIKGKDKDPLLVKKPKITNLTPPSLEAGSAATEIEIAGENFDEKAKVFFDEKEYSPTSVSQTLITLSLPAADLLKAKDWAVTVVNSNEERSNAWTFKVESKAVG